MVLGVGVAEEVDLLGRKDRSQMTLFIPGSLDQLVPDDHILKRVDRVLDLSWLKWGQSPVVSCRYIGSGNLMIARHMMEAIGIDFYELGRARIP